MNPLADRYSQPFFSLTVVDATCAVQSAEMMLTDADIGALEKLYRHRAASELKTKL